MNLESGEKLVNHDRYAEKEGGPDTAPIEGNLMELEEFDRKKRSQLNTDAKQILNLREQLMSPSESSTEKTNVTKYVEESNRGEVLKPQEHVPLSGFARLKGYFNEWINKSENTPDDNILYRPDRLYRCIGTKGYEDFLKTGRVDSKNKKLYVDVSFNVGQPSSRYRKGDSGSYILEATPEAADFQYKTHPFSGEPMKDISYRGAGAGELSKNSKIRIYRKIGENVFDVAFDNIGDEALKK